MPLRGEDLSKLANQQSLLTLATRAETLTQFTTKNNSTAYLFESTQIP